MDQVINYGPSKNQNLR